MLSTPADFPFFSNCTAVSTTLRRMVWSSSVRVWGQSSTDLHWPFDYTAQCSILSIGSVSLVLRQVFHELLCLLSVVLPQIFFNLSTLFSYQVYFAFFMHLLMLLFTSLYFSDPSGSNRFFLSSSGSNRFFLSSFLLSHRSRISAVTQGFFLLMVFAKYLTGCFSQYCVEGGDH